MAGLQVSGLGSGLDIDSLVTKLMAVEQQPLANINLKTTKLQTQISAMGTMKASFDKFNAALTALRAPAAQTSLTGATATSSDPSVVSGTISGKPGVSNYAVTVTSLAASQKLVSASVATDPTTPLSTTAGSITFEKGAISGGTFDSVSGLYSGASFTTSSTASVSIPAGSSLNQIRDAINSSSAGVRASVVFDGTNYKLTLASTATGAQQSLRVSAAGDTALSSFFSYDASGAQGFKQTQAASDLKANIDGIDITSAGNTLDKAIDGLSLVVNKVGTSTLSVSQSSTAISTTLSSLVSAWNELAGQYTALASYNSATKLAGPLYGDSYITNTFNQLRQSVFGSSFPGASANYQTLSSVGITLNSAGLATLDASKLSNALGQDSQAVSKLFSTTAGNAGATAISQLTAALSSTGFQARVDGLNKRVATFATQKANLQERLEATEKTMRQRFTNLDSLISSLNQTSTFLSQKFSSTNSN